jgi:hypothetical protein
MGSAMASRVPTTLVQGLNGFEAANGMEVIRNIANQNPEFASNGGFAHGRMVRVELEHQSCQLSFWRSTMHIQKSARQVDDA